MPIGSNGVFASKEVPVHVFDGPNEQDRILGIYQNGEFGDEVLMRVYGDIGDNETPTYFSHATMLTEPVEYENGKIAVGLDGAELDLGQVAEVLKNLRPFELPKK